MLSLRLLLYLSRLSVLKPLNAVQTVVFTGQAVKEIGADMNFLFSVVISLVALVLSIDVHEFAHAWMATHLGDTTAQRLGRLSLNPLVHLDPAGTIMMLLSALSGFGIGWGKPVPVNPYNLRTDPRTGMGLVAVSGPVSNLILASLAALPLRLLPLPGALQFILWLLALINIALAVFNLLPIYPLDGYSVLLGILNAVGTGWAQRWTEFWTRQEALGPGLLILLIIIDRYIPIMQKILDPPITILRQLILGS